MTDEIRAVGADGCRAGWVTASLVGTEAERIELAIEPTITTLAAWRDQSAPTAVVALDVPIGLTRVGGFRACDIEARQRLGSLASSVFAPPARYLLQAKTYKEVQALVAAERLENDAAVPGVSAQAAGLIPRIAEVDDFVRRTPAVQGWLIEVHPELSFREWAGQALPTKKSPGGAIARLNLARRRFPGLDDALASLTQSKVGLDDALDACAALWSALRWKGDAVVLGGDADAEGVVMRMVV